MERNLKPKSNVTDSVYQQLLEQIITRRYQPGDRIPPENELKEEFNVSRNTLRTVLNKLNALGILETRRGDGTYVKKIGMQMYLNAFIPAILINADSLMELMQFRKAIEVASARIAAVQATEDDIARIQECFYISINAGNDMKIHAESIFDFHFQIVRASKNQMFETMMELIKYILTSKMVNFLNYSRYDGDSTFYHQMILSCIKDHKPDEAAYMMERHMTILVDQVDEYNEYVKKHPESGL